MKYKIAITLLPEVGVISAKKLIAYCGGAEAVFKESKKNLNKIPGVSKNIIDSIYSNKVIERAEKEVEFAKKNNIEIIDYLSDDYPYRLKHCVDSPIVLFKKGNADFNKQKVLSIVGTRQISSYGKKLCKQLVEKLANLDVLVVSGLAYGVDICAHKESVKRNITNVAVLGNSLDRIYPALHKEVVDDIVLNGAVLSEFLSGTKPDAVNFPKRNRIVAGMSDATVVIESPEKGGSIITANLAFDYNRSVMAFPGNVYSKTSKGCNNLIKRNTAQMITSADDLLKELNWFEDSKDKKSKKIQRQLFVDLSDDEKRILEIIEKNGKPGIDFISVESKIPMTQTSSLLLSMELNGIVTSLPGKKYCLT